MTTCFELRHSAARVGCLSASGDYKDAPCVATHCSLGERASTELEERGQLARLPPDITADPRKTRNFHNTHGRCNYSRHKRKPF